MSNADYPPFTRNIRMLSAFDYKLVFTKKKLNLCVSARLHRRAPFRVKEIVTNFPSAIHHILQACTSIYYTISPTYKRPFVFYLNQKYIYAHVS